MLNIVLFQPEIPHNTGAIGRLCLATGARLHLIKPLGFSLEDKHLKRAGLDYWQEVDLRVWESWEALRSKISADAEVYFIECQGTTDHWDSALTAPEVFLVFGPETRGIPISVIDPDKCLRIPMQGTRSLNLATAAGIVMYEALRQRTRAGILS
ncbi:MAG: tRNA (cytidine(34)-2'-O)-methyltransferase [Verrucomicrobiaceae bacterium]|jgi:tRNA (cytidine/uridine-2'-O-)-methyltransferase|nr:tRNA (cytidine(34)-2'-O)-methyltransferase [Verrucomicrobiaceae bacterium]